MIYNELIFVLHVITVTVIIALATRIGKEALIAVMALQAVLANLFVTQEITLFTLNITSSDVFAVGGSLTLNLLLEYYDKKTAYRAIAISFAGLIFYTIMSYFHLWYTPAPTDVMRPHFTAILQPAARLLGASLLAYLAAQITVFFLYRTIQKYVTSQFVIRNYLVISASQLVDTCTFALVGLYGIVSSVGSIILASYTIKLFSIFLITSLVALARPKK